MKHCRAGAGQLIFLLAAVLCAVAAETPKLTFTYTTIKVKGAQSTALFGINNAGVMVGAYVDSSNVTHGFRLANGKVKKIDDPNGVTTYCFGINNAGAIVGYYATSSFTTQAFLYKNGTFTDIGPTGATGSQAIGINDHGDVNGNYGDSSGASHGFLLKAGKYTTLDVPGAAYTLGGGINNAGPDDGGLAGSEFQLPILALQRKEVHHDQCPWGGRYLCGGD